MSHNCYTSEQATKKNRGEWQDFFCFSEIFFKSPPNMRLSHFETTPADASAIQAVTPSNVFSWPRPDVHLMGQSERTGIENNWYALTGARSCRKS
jgi:hypothetical protein